MRVPIVQIQQTPARLEIRTDPGAVQIQGSMGRTGLLVKPSPRPNPESISPSGVALDGSGDVQFSAIPAQVTYQMAQRPSVSFSVTGGNFDLLAG